MQKNVFQKTVRKNNIILNFKNVNTSVRNFLKNFQGQARIKF